MDKDSALFSTPGEAANSPYTTPTTGYRFEQNALMVQTMAFSALSPLVTVPQPVSG